VDAANDLELPRSNVRYERFSPIAPSSDDQAFEVRLKRSGKTVHVAANVSILDAVLAAGVAAKYGCCSGQCGQCAVEILEGKADHRDTALNEVDRMLFGPICICVSRARGDGLVLDL
jgi:ferredoxin